MDDGDDGDVCDDDDTNEDDGDTDENANGNALAGDDAVSTNNDTISIDNCVFNIMIFDWCFWFLIIYKATVFVL